MLNGVEVAMRGGVFDNMVLNICNYFCKEKEIIYGCSCKNNLIRLTF